MTLQPPLPAYQEMVFFHTMSVSTLTRPAKILGSKNLGQKDICRISGRVLEPHTLLFQPPFLQLEYEGSILTIYFVSRNETRVKGGGRGEARRRRRRTKRRRVKKRRRRKRRVKKRRRRKRGGEEEKEEEEKKEDEEEESEEEEEEEEGRRRGEGGGREEGGQGEGE
ncbi:hypothetical protein PoB_001700400 [Plakobranchus ocellatus]|uniref:Uncharacterized protein n=1 Tax=Plakobranchus ocellatus TaxID=259542 RepID=A0AAV3Z7Z6_9GAST|nr:hypothetical protein PoB_001700400 [Plakobranchus ocellatus]